MKVHFTSFLTGARRQTRLRDILSSPIGYLKEKCGKVVISPILSGWLLSLVSFPRGWSSGRSMADLVCMSILLIQSKLQYCTVRPFIFPLRRFSSRSPVALVTSSFSLILLVLFYFLLVVSTLPEHSSDEQSDQIGDMTSRLALLGQAKNSGLWQRHTCSGQPVERLILVLNSSCSPFSLWKDSISPLLA